MALIAIGIAASTVAMTITPAAGATVRGSEWWLTGLQVRQAWTATKGSGVTVAVLSDGVDASQADLTGSVTSGPNEVSGAPDSGQFFGQLGTGLASLIAGHGHGAGDASGIIGVAPQAKILSVPVTLPSTDPLLAQTSVAAALPGDIATGIRYAVAHGASVIDLPIDPGQPNADGIGGAAAAAGGSSAERAAVRYALAHNVVLVAPAGDDGSGSDAANFPAAYRGVISVGAFSSAFIKAPWTSHQSYVTITAAGVDVVAAANDGGYQTISSTSAASAIVAGIAALIRSRYPSLNAAQVRQALISGTKFHGKTAGSGNGTADAQLALAAAAAQVPAGTPAGTGALPLVTQPAPAAAPKSLPSTLMRDGIVSAALLGLLLLLISLYTVLRRRRTVRKQEAIAAEWTGRHPQSRYPRPGTEGDRMLEYFAAPLQGPGAGGPGPAGQGATAPAVSALGLFATANREPVGSQASGRPITSRITGAPPASPQWDDLDGVGSPGSGLASREVSRRPAVSGEPPWGPAVQPDSDLPWAAATQDFVAGMSQPTGQASYTSAVRTGGQAVALPARLAGSSGADAVTPGPGNGAPGTANGPAANGPAANEAAGPEGVAGGPGTLARRPAGGPGSAIAAARAGVAAAAQEAQARFAAAQPNAGDSGSGPLGPPSGSGSLWERSLPASASSVATPGEAPAEMTWPGKPTSSGLTGPSMTGGLDWRKDLAPPSAGDLASSAPGFTPPSARAEPEYPAQEPGGPLPVRQPRLSAQEAPLSPSGSLWERAVDSPEQPAAGPDTGSRPIYVWNPGSPTESYPATPRDSDRYPVPEPADSGALSSAWDAPMARDSSSAWDAPMARDSSSAWDAQPPPDSSSWDIQPPPDSSSWDIQPPLDGQPARENRPPWDTQPPWDGPSPWDSQPPWDSQT